MKLSFWIQITNIRINFNHLDVDNNTGFDEIFYQEYKEMVEYCSEDLTNKNWKVNEIFDGLINQTIINSEILKYLVRGDILHPSLFESETQSNLSKDALKTLNQSEIVFLIKSKMWAEGQISLELEAFHFENEREMLKEISLGNI